MTSNALCTTTTPLNLHNHQLFLFLLFSSLLFFCWSWKTKASALAQAISIRNHKEKEARKLNQQELLPYTHSYIHIHKCYVRAIEYYLRWLIIFYWETPVSDSTACCLLSWRKVLSSAFMKLIGFLMLLILWEMKRWWWWWWKKGLEVAHNEAQFFSVFQISLLGI